MSGLPARSAGDALPEAVASGGGFAEVQVLTGHSGARVVLCTQDALSLVRKSASSPAGNARLLRQAEKQRLLAAHGIPLPRVIAQGADASGIAFFDMEYVPARTLASIVAAADAYDRVAVLSAVDRLLWLFNRSRGDEIPAATFTDKIDDVAAKCLTHAPAEAHRDTVREVQLALRERRWSGIPQSPCHGDLTLENTLISPAQGVVFIDCDEPFVSSFWLDAGKLFQDVFGYWCLRHHLQRPSPGPLVLNAVQKLDQLRAELSDLFGQIDPAMGEALTPLAALNLFRTLPYTRDEETVYFVLGRMRHILGLAT